MSIQMRVVNRRLIIMVIIAGISIGLLLKYLFWRIQEIGIDGLSVLIGITVVAILAISGWSLHREYCRFHR